MKKLLSMVLALTLVASLGIVSVSAAYGNGYGAFVDANGDGVCDNVGSGCGNGYYFVDGDGDGVCVCDNYGSFIGRTTCGGNRCQR